MTAVDSVVSSKKLSTSLLLTVRRFASLPRRQNQGWPQRWPAAAAACAVEVDTGDPGRGRVGSQLLDSDSNVARTNGPDGHWIDADSPPSPGSFLAAINRSEGSGGDGDSDGGGSGGASNLNDCDDEPHVEEAEQVAPRCPTSDSHTRRWDDTTRRSKSQGIGSNHAHVVAAHVDDLHHDDERELDGVDEVGMASGERRL